MSRFTEDYKRIVRLGLPIVVGQAGMIVVGFADNIMVGRYSTEALASASFVNNLFNIAILTCVGFTYGITPLVGALFTGGKPGAIGRLTRNALALNILFALAVTAVMGVIYCLLPRLGQPEELLPLIRPYFLLYLAGVLPIALYNVFAQWSYGINRTAMPMWIILAANVLNIGGNYLLIYGNFGCPEMGLTGAGIATLAARWLCPLVIAGIFFISRSNKEYRSGFVHGRVNAPDLRRLWSTSIPVSLQLCFETGSFSAAAVMAGWIGKVELAAFQVMVVVGSLGFCFYYSLGTATSVLVANEAGRGDHRAMRRVGFAGYHLTLLMALLASASFAFAGEHLVGLFTHDPAVITCAMALIPPLLLYQLADATQVNFANALRGTSHVMPMLWIAFLSYVVIGLPATYLLSATIEGIFYSFSISLMCAAAGFTYFFLRHTR